MTAIGLVGAVGAGKTEFARGLARALEQKGGRYQPVAIVDDYVAEVEQTLDLACGFLGSYVADSAVALARFGAERQAVRDGAQTVITCGTLAETATYTAINVTLSQNEYSWAVANVTMPYYSLLSRNMMDYDEVLYLPLREGPDLDVALDSEVESALRGFQVPYRIITESFGLAEVVELLTGAA